MGGFFNSPFETTQVMRRAVDPQKLIEDTSTSAFVEPGTREVLEAGKRTGKRKIRRPKKVEKIEEQKRVVLGWQAEERAERAWRELMEAEEMERKKRMEKSAGN